MTLDDRLRLQKLLADYRRLEGVCAELDGLRHAITITVPTLLANNMDGFSVQCKELFEQHFQQRLGDPLDINDCFISWLKNEMKTIAGYLESYYGLKIEEE